MSWTFCTSGAAVAKAGTHANTTATTSGAILSKWSDETEGRIEAECHSDFTTNYSTLSTGIKNALSDVASSLIANNIVMYDSTGYLAREADILLNVNDERASKGIATLKDKNKQKLGSP